MGSIGSICHPEAWENEGVRLKREPRPPGKGHWQPTGALFTCRQTAMGLGLRPLRRGASQLVEAGVSEEL